MTVPEVTVVMANYNGARYLSAAIKSLQSQTLKSWELIFVDDASRDQSVELAQRFAEADPRIKIVRQPANRGPGAARNRALRMAQGRWLAVFDSDDLMRPKRLEVLRDRARNDRASIVADNLLIFSSRETAPQSLLPRDGSQIPRWIGLAEYIESGLLYSRTADLGYLKPFISLDLLRRSGTLYDESLRIGEDFELMVRVLSCGLKLRFEPSAQYMYRKHASSISHRLQAENIAAMIEANERLKRSIGSPSEDVLTALRRRGRSLKTLLLYDRVIMMLKAGEYRKALIAGLGAPSVWPLLTRPLRARIARLAPKTGRPRIGGMSHALDG
jgi:succinoglycan biosynthesis protein ExoO